MNLKSTLFRLSLAAGLLLVFSATRASAITTSATQVAPCPQIGWSNGCDVVITLSNNGSGGVMASVNGSTGNSAYDGCDDQLVGVINNSSQTITGLVLNGSGIGGFDGDGAWSSACLTVGGAPYGCGTPTSNGDPQDYEGPDTTFPTFSNNSVTVLFDTPLGNGGTAFFSLEESPSVGNISVGTINPTPEPGTLVLFGTGLIGLAGAIRRKLAK